MCEELGPLYQQIEAASQNKSQFLASMSHELRTPLNAIIGLTEMMVTNAARFGTEKAMEPLQRVHRAGTYLLGLINQVLDLSKIEAGKLELNPQTVQLVPLIDEVVGTARQLADQNKNRLTAEAPDDLGSLTVDPMRLRQILFNLLSNACKFSKGGEVNLKRRTRLDRDRCGRQRHRHDARAAGEAVRGVRPGRYLDRTAFRRHRARSSHHAQARAHNGRRRDRGERTW
jgi:signal transduction histidine kinase